MSTRRIAAVVACLALAFVVYVGAPLLTQRPPATTSAAPPKPVVEVDGGERRIPSLEGLVPTPLTRELAADNDLAVLSLVLKDLCKGQSKPLLLHDVPDELAHERKQLDSTRFPPGIDRACALVKIEPSAKLDAAVAGKPPCPESEESALPLWRCFHRHYPEAHGTLRMGLPVYYRRDELIATVDTGTSCGPLCGEGQRFVLAHRAGAWKLLAVQGTWIA